MGGAQAIAALAYGTATVAAGRRDRGPGQRLRAGGQAPGRRDGSGIDGIAGPTELLVIADAEADPRARRARPRRAGRARRRTRSWWSLSARARRCSTRSSARRRALAASAPTVAGRAAGARAHAPTSRRRSTLANAFAPEHLELACADAERLAERVRASGCVFVGGAGGAAFGDYAAGSNHVLPTGGAARFSGPLGAATFRRRQALVSLPAAAARALAPHVSSVARAEGFPVHAESAEASGRRTVRRAQRSGTPMATTTPPRAAEIERSTRETQIRLRLALDGSGECAASRPASGFLDHMLDLLARHAPARPRRGGDRRSRDRRAPHDRGRRHRARAGARPGARRPQRHRALRRRDGADGRGARRRARSTSAAGRTARSTATLPPATIGGLRDRAGRGVLPRGRQQREADRAPARCSPARTRTT